MLWICDYLPPINLWNFPKMINQNHPKAKELSAATQHVINHLHILRDEIKLMAEQNEELAVKLWPLWEANEFAIQDLWGFEKNSANHKDWYKFPYCTCPKLDNNDAFPYRQYVKASCPIHGYWTKNENN